MAERRTKAYAAVGVDGSVVLDTIQSSPELVESLRIYAPTYRVIRVEIVYDDGRYGGE